VTWTAARFSTTPGMRKFVVETKEQLDQLKKITRYAGLRRMEMEDSGYELMRHALGVQAYCTTKSKGGTRYKKPYRNYFVAGGDHVKIWEDLVAKGFATKRTDGNELTGGDPCFHVTEAGKAAAIDGIAFKKRWGYGTPVNA
jgi:hypothetical protein